MAIFMYVWFFIFGSPSPPHKGVNRYFVYQLYIFIPTGHHFWSFNSENLDNSCFAEDMFPGFVLYDKKNAPIGFGWVLVMDLPSTKYENIPVENLGVSKLAVIFVPIINLTNVNSNRMQLIRLLLIFTSFF